MNRLAKMISVREKLTSSKVSIGSWMQIPNASIAEILGSAGYDWVAIDMEHGAITLNQLPDIFRALELGNTLPIVRLSEGSAKECKNVLDAGSAGVIAPMIENADQLRMIANACRWPPSGNRGVGFSRANLFGKNFKKYQSEAQEPLLVAMIENNLAIDNLDEILKVDGLDAILIGPYDLSASLGILEDFQNPLFKSTVDKIFELCEKNNIPCGIHVVNPDINILNESIDNGYRFIAYSIDAVFLNSICVNPMKD
jgi:2-dehydro-3-deoxyglucarate aldolase